MMHQQPSDNTLQRLPQQPSVIMQAPPALMVGSYGSSNSMSQSCVKEGSYLNVSDQVGSAFKNDIQADQIPVTASENS